MSERNPLATDFVKLSLAKVYYQQYGYQYIDVPWFVEDKIDAVTRPADRLGISTKFGNLIGSGEQGFIQLMAQKVLAPGYYQTITPCFRDEPEVDIFHSVNFMKLELIYIPIDKNDFESRQADYVVGMLATAAGVIRRISSASVTFKTVQTEHGFDLQTELLNIEVGSYGARSHGELNWIYGTGLAEPRLSIAEHLEDLFK